MTDTKAWNWKLWAINVVPQNAQGYYPGQINLKNTISPLKSQEQAYLRESEEDFSSGFSE